MPEYMSPWEIAAYANREDQLRTNYQNSLATSAYGRARAGLQHSMAYDSMTRDFNRQRERVPMSFVGRGVLHSGMYKRALSDYADSRLRGLTNLDLGYQDQMGGFDLQDLNSANTYNNTGLTNISAERAARRAQLAAQLREVM